MATAEVVSNGEPRHAANWKALIGLWTTEDATVRYDGPGEGIVGVPYGLARSSQRFRDTIFYNDTIGGKQKVEELLRRHLEAVRRDS